MMMNQIFDFLKSYYKEIIDISVLIISVVICLIRKRPCVNKMDSIKEDVLRLLPVLIDMVEKDGHGEEKKSTVMSMAISYIEKKYHIDASVMDSFLDESIESILSTPQKKGK